jgi:DNA-binding transcriptional regulator YiaG
MFTLFVVFGSWGENICDHWRTLVTTYSEAIKQACVIIRDEGDKPRWEPPSGDKIRGIRQRLGLTQQQFSEQFRIDLGTLRAWEQGRNKPECFNALFLTMLDRDTDGISATVRRIESEIGKEREPV